jgi:hypothetical protein
MVMYTACRRLVWGALAVQEPAQPLLERLDPPKRAAVLMTILGLVLTGLMLVAGVMIGAHWVRRMARHMPRRKDRTAQLATNSDRDATESPIGTLPEAGTDRTVQIDAKSAETKIDP